MTLDQFGQTIKAKYPQYQDMGNEELGQKIIAQYPQYGDMVDQTSSLGGVAQSAVGDAQSAIQGLSNPNSPLQKLAPSSQDFTNPVGSTGSKLQAIGNLIKGQLGEYGDLLQHPIKHGTTHPLNTILDLLPFLKGASSLKAASEATTPAEMAQTAYKASEQVTDAAGSVNSALLKKHFGTLENPNPELYKGITTPDRVEALKALIRKHIVAQNRAPEGASTATSSPSEFAGETVSGPDAFGNQTTPFTFGDNTNQTVNTGIPDAGVTYNDLLAMRKGAYNQGHFSSGNPTDTQALNQNIGRAYSSIIHEGIPETKAWDQLYQDYKNADTENKKQGALTRMVKYVTAHPYTSYFVGRGIGDLIGNITKSPGTAGPSSQPTNNQFQSDFGTYYKSH